MVGDGRIVGNAESRGAGPKFRNSKVKSSSLPKLHQIGVEDRDRDGSRPRVRAEFEGFRFSLLSQLLLSQLSLAPLALASRDRNWCLLVLVQQPLHPWVIHKSVKYRDDDSS